MPPVELRELGAGHLEKAARVVGRGMRDNPLHRRAFGADAERREKGLARFFLPVLRLYLTKGTLLGAFQDGQLVGVCGMLPPGRCQPTVAERLRLLPGVVRAAPGAVLSILRWTREWARRDLGRAHWHLGPVAVDRERQGCGIGTAMLAEFCRRVDDLGALAYLETDQARSVTFFERRAFEIRAHASVLDTHIWYMVRGGNSRRPSR